MEFISWLAEGFVSLFEAGGAQFMDWVTGIIPQVVCLMTFVNAIIKCVGEDRVTNFAHKVSGNIFGRYLLIPVISVLFLANPMCYTFGRFCEEKYKPAVYDATVSFVHPVTGLFPHANAGELFVYQGIAVGVASLGYSLGNLAVRYFIVGLIVIFIRGIVTEKMYGAMLSRRSPNADSEA